MTHRGWLTQLGSRITANDPTSDAEEGCQKCHRQRDQCRPVEDGPDKVVHRKTSSAWSSFLASTL
jgi:hypothetical protein